MKWLQSVAYAEICHGKEVGFSKNAKHTIIVVGAWTCLPPKKLRKKYFLGF